MPHRRRFWPMLAALASVAASASAALDGGRGPCGPSSQPRPRGSAHLQLWWNDCDAAQNPVDPYWLDPRVSPVADPPAPIAVPPSTGGSECDGFPVRGESLALPAACTSESFWISVPERGIQKLSCKHLRYFPHLLDALFPAADLYGHANLDVVAMTGKVRFLEQAQPDLDYNFALLKPPGPSAITQDNPKLSDGRPFVGLEFYAPESIDRFRGRWWQGLRREVLGAEPPASRSWWTVIVDMVTRRGEDADRRWAGARSYVGETDAYAVGLYGLDCQHGCAAELHPVYALALRASSAPGTDRWAFFARNSGSEGFCSNGRLIDVGLDYLALLLTPPGGTAVAFESDPRIDVWRHPRDASVRWTLLPVKEGALLLVQFGGDPRSQMLEGEVVIRWQ